MERKFNGAFCKVYPANSYGSHGLIIPMEIAERAGISNGSTVRMIETEDGCILIKKLEVV